ncbi:phosphotransferase [Paenibacillus sp. alder61]|uniref:phosphotransferase n=1 Tax=Paenibacillus TaxID=44249 RepID=UPI001CD41C1F|nr:MULTISPECIES: phosphotransferase [Paenibacillus]MCA1292305.1 phosphotransferase [Paenibacillus sp. alder61]
MDSTGSEEQIWEDIENSLRRRFGIEVFERTPIRRGWLNLKWKVSTDAGQLLIKQYNRERFKLYKSEELLRAFSQQIRLRESGLPCPRLLSDRGEVFVTSEDGERFLVMEFCEGSLVLPGRVGERQIHDLGLVTARMHHLLNDGTLGAKASPQFVPPSCEERMGHWRSLRQTAAAAGDDRLVGEVETQLRATEVADIDRFAGAAMGWAHRDLWVDNLLFFEDRVAAVLDFDRLNYDYPALDAARAVISCALDDQGRLDAFLARAFMAGYTEERHAASGFLTQALQLLW